MSRCTTCGRVLANPRMPVCLACGAPVADDPIDVDAGEPTRPVPAVTSVEGAGPVAAPAREPEIVVERGPNEGSRWMLRAGSTSLGRHPKSDILLDDITVSRRHAVVTRHGTALHLEDVGSLNGTYLNGERIEMAQTLRHGDRVQVGRYRLVILAPRASG